MAAEPKAKLTLVDRALEADGVTVGDATRKVLNAHAGSIAKQAKREATSELLNKLGAQTLEDASQLTQIRAERDARVSVQEETKHGRHRFWQGVAAGSFVTLITLGIGMAIYTRSVLDPAFDAAARMQMQQDVVNTLRDGAQP